MNNSNIPELAIIDGKVFITSRQITEDFDKSHKNVIQNIETAQVSENFRKLNFQLSEYSVEGQSRKYKQYILTRNGFTMIAMGYRDPKFMRFKEDYIAAFDMMEEQLRNAQPTITATQLTAIRDEMSNITRYMKHEGQSLAQSLYRKMKAEFGYSKIEQMPPEQYEQVLRWLKPYQAVAHKVYDITNSIEREFISKVKEQSNTPDELLLEMNDKQLQLN